MTITMNNTPGWKTYSVFGLTLASEYAFADRLIATDGKPNLTFTCVNVPPISISWDHVSPTYTSPHKLEDGSSIIHLYRLETCDVLRFTQDADFYLWNDCIICHLPDPACGHAAEGHLLATVLAFWLERLGICVLHASAVAAGGQTVAFLSDSGNGKSTLAATLMQAGLALLTDDILPLEQRDGISLGRSGFPYMRMWPNEARHFLGYYESLETVLPGQPKRWVPIGKDGFGEFCNSARPLACFYLPERRDPTRYGNKIEIAPLAPRDAVIELVRHSFTPRIAAALGWHAHRLDFFTQLVRQVPVRRLAYPSGLEYLPAVRAAILADSGFSG